MQSMMLEHDSNRILVVEDDDEMRDLLVDYLGSSGFETAGASSVPEAQERLAGRRYDLVVSDLSLPGKSGLTLLRELLNQRERPKVIIITAFGDWRTYVDAMSMGASEYMSKPFRMEDLVQKIRTTLAA